MTARLIRAGQAVLAGLSTILVLTTSAQAAAAAANSQGFDSTPPPDRITVTVVTVNGSGCPAGTATVTPFPDSTGFRVTYRQFIARVGADADPTDFRKNCQLNLGIHVPQGFTYAIAQATYRGFAHLENGATGLLRAAYYFQGSSDTVYLDHTLTGPFSDLWRATDSTPVVELVFAPCGRDVNLNINSELRVHASASDPEPSFMAMNSTRGDIDTLFQFHWKHCP
jgi:hypothetical protein